MSAVVGVEETEDFKYRGVVGWLVCGRGLVRRIGLIWGLIWGSGLTRGCRCAWYWIDRSAAAGTAGAEIAGRTSVATLAPVAAAGASSANAASASTVSSWALTGF